MMNTNETIKPASLFFLLCLSMIAFAGNSIVARLAMQTTQIDAASFTSVRIISAAIMLWLIILTQQSSKNKASEHQITQKSPSHQNNYLIQSGFVRRFGPPFYLFVYAACFSLAYRNIDAGIGALILFASVQLTMIGVGLLRGERLNKYAILGLSLSFTGLMVLLLPIETIIASFINPNLSENVLSTTPDFISACSMIVSGIAWGAYSLSGQNTHNSTMASAYNFLYAIPLTLVLSAFLWQQISFDWVGFFYACISGAVISAYGYIIWHKVLPLIRSITASALQLSVPVIAAIGGIIFLNEPFTLPLVLVSMVILSGIALVVFNRN